VGYASGVLQENRKQLTLQKGQAYADYLRALAIAATGSQSKEATSLAAEAKTKICIYGCLAVIKQLSAFEQAGAKIVSDESRTIVAHMLKAMRRDMGASGSQVEEADLHYILFGAGGPTTGAGGLRKDQK
jgi:hypothetical protein